MECFRSRPGLFDASFARLTIGGQLSPYLFALDVGWNLQYFIAVPRYHHHFDETTDIDLMVRMHYKSNHS